MTNELVSVPTADVQGRAPGGMWWVAWRQHRLTVVVGAGLLVVTALASAVFRWSYTTTIMVDPSACLDAQCVRIWQQVAGFQASWVYLRMLLLTLPALVGVVLGASIVAQERDRGTQVFALTQSVGRARWYLTKCAVVLVPAVAAAVLAGLTADWAIAAAPGVESPLPMQAPRFQITGLVPGAFLLLSFGLAVAVGSLIRSGLGAVIVGLVVASSAVVVLGVWWYLALVPEDRARLPLTIDNVYGSVYLDTMTPGSLVRRMGYAGAGGAEMSFVDACRESGRAAQPAADVRCLAQHGVTDRLIVYVDGSRYAQLVATLGGACATVAGLGIGFGLWRLRRQVL